MDDHRHLVICPIPHDGSFMQVFYEGWRIVQALCSTGFKTPKEVLLPHPQHREVARIYSERREFPVVEVIEATGTFAQPHLLETTTETVRVQNFEVDKAPGTSTIITPRPLPRSGT